MAMIFKSTLTIPNSSSTQVHLDLHEMLGKSKTYYPKWWFDVFDGDLPWYKVKNHRKSKSMPSILTIPRMVDLKTSLKSPGVFQQQLPPFRSKKGVFLCELCVFGSDQGALITSTTRITMALSTKPPLKAQTKIQVAVNFHQPKTPKTTDGFLSIKLAASYWNRRGYLLQRSRFCTTQRYPRIQGRRRRPKEHVKNNTL